MRQIMLEQDYRTYQYYLSATVHPPGMIDAS